MEQENYFTIRVADKKVLQVLNSLQDADFNRREAAKLALLEEGMAALPVLLKAISASEAVIRWEAVKILIALGKPEVLPLLLDALRDKTESIAWLAANGIRRIARETPEVVKQLLETGDIGHVSPKIARFIAEQLPDDARNESTSS